MCTHLESRFLRSANVEEAFVVGALACIGAVEWLSSSNTSKSFTRQKDKFHLRRLCWQCQCGSGTLALPAKPPKKKPAFQMSVPEDFEVLDDDNHSTAPIQGNTRDEHGSRTGGTGTGTGTDTNHRYKLKESKKEKAIRNIDRGLVDQEKNEVCCTDSLENDWWYMAVTAFLVKLSGSSTLVLYFVVACFIPQLH
ncbi:hypothetical protein Tco_1252909 [Tanacetum coccineum]